MIPERGLVFAGLENGKALKLKIKKLQTLKMYEISQWPITYLDYDNDNDNLIVSTYGGYLKIWDTRKDIELKEIGKF